MSHWDSSGAGRQAGWWLIRGSACFNYAQCTHTQESQLRLQWSFKLSSRWAEGSQSDQETFVPFLLFSSYRLLLASNYFPCEGSQTFFLSQKMTRGAGRSRVVCTKENLFPSLLFGQNLHSGGQLICTAKNQVQKKKLGSSIANP